MYQTSAFLLRLEPRRDVDQLAIWYTQSYGKITTVARGTKKIISKLNPHIRHAARVDIEFVRGRFQHQLIGAVSQTAYPTIVADMRRIALSSLAIELVTLLTPNEHPDQGVFDVLERTLEALAQTDVSITSAWLATERAVAMNILTATGFRPTESAVESQQALHAFIHTIADQPVKSLAFCRTMVARTR